MFGLDLSYLAFTRHVWYKPGVFGSHLTYWAFWPGSVLAGGQSLWPGYDFPEPPVPGL